MAARDALWRDHQRARWLRPDAHRWIKPDAGRFLKPGVATASVFPSTEAKYSPSQPRVPAGNPRGGQWTRDQGGSGGSGAFALGGGGGFAFGGEGGDIAFDGSGFDLGALSFDSTGDGGGIASIFDGLDLSDGVPFSDVEPPSFLDLLFGRDETQVQLVQGRDIGRPIDLLDERELGGHTIERHVGRSEQSLLADVRDTFGFAERRGDFAEGLRQGSFSSMESANKLVNSTIAQNPDKVDLVVRGLSPRERLDAEFGSPTGIEAFGRNARSQVTIRDTYGVRVIIVPDSRSERGFRVDSAFPRNND